MKNGVLFQVDLSLQKQDPSWDLINIWRRVPLMMNYLSSVDFQSRLWIQKIKNGPIFELYLNSLGLLNARNKSVFFFFCFYFSLSHSESHLISKKKKKKKKKVIAHLKTTFLKKKRLEKCPQILLILYLAVSGIFKEYEMVRYPEKIFFSLGTPLWLSWAIH